MWTYSVPLPPFLHPECHPSAPAAGRRPAVRPDTPWSADGNAAPTPHWTGPLTQQLKSAVLKAYTHTDLHFETFSPSPDLHQGWRAFGPYVTKPRKRSPSPSTLRHIRKRCQLRCASDGEKSGAIKQIEKYSAQIISRNVGMCVAFF